MSLTTFAPNMKPYYEKARAEALTTGR